MDSAVSRVGRLIIMAETAGIEPTAFDLENRCLYPFELRLRWYPVLVPTQAAISHLETTMFIRHRPSPEAGATLLF